MILVSIVAQVHLTLPLTLTQEEKEEEEEEEAEEQEEEMEMEEEDDERTTESTRDAATMVTEAGSAVATIQVRLHSTLKLRFDYRLIGLTLHLDLI